MPAFRLFSRLNTFYGLTGQLLAGGLLRFYNAGTTTPRNVYGDPDLSINNGVSVALDSSGRPNVDVWGDGAYFVEVFDSLGVKQGEADNVQIPGAGGQAIPGLETGKFLTNNGAVLLWATIREVPDPTGQGGKVLSTDGEALLWQSQPEPYVPPEPDESAGASGYIQFGDVRIQWGTDICPASNTKSATKAVTFPVSFDEAPYHVTPTPKIGAIVGNGSTVTCTYTSPGTGGFNAFFSIADDDNKPDKIISVPVPFTWFAIGKKVAA